MNLSATFSQHFETIEDSRVDNHNCCHKIIDILLISISVRICGAMIGMKSMIMLLRKKAS